MLSAENVLLVEGESDAELLRAWFPRLLVSRQIAVVPLGGSDRAYHIGSVEQVMGSADALARRMLFLRDRDELSEQRIAQLEADGRIAVLGRRELENYLLDDPRAVLSVLEWRAAQPGYQVAERFDEGGLSEALRAEADALRHISVLKRVVEEAVPPRVLSRRGVRNVIAAGGTLEALRAAVEAGAETATRALAELDAAWEQQEAQVAAEWNERWRELVAGSDLLEAIWRRAGGRYDKGTDGARIAEAMSEPPAEVSALLSSLLDARTESLIGQEGGPSQPDA